MRRNMVVKIGGSLLEDPVAMCDSLETLIGRSGEIAIVNGSGSLRHQQRSWLERAGVMAEPAKDLSLLRQQRLITSHLLACLRDDLVVVSSMRNVRAAWRDSRVPIVDTGALLPELNTTPMGTDTVAAKVCSVLETPTMLKLTNVDGVLDGDGSVIERMSYERLRSMGQTCVDIGTADVLQFFRLGCFVLNGFNTDNLEHHMTNQQAIGTYIGGEND